MRLNKAQNVLTFVAATLNPFLLACTASCTTAAQMSCEHLAHRPHLSLDMWIQLGTAVADDARSLLQIAYLWL